MGNVSKRWKSTRSKLRELINGETKIDDVNLDYQREDGK
jgi:hypothetical protein